MGKFCIGLIFFVLIGGMAFIGAEALIVGDEESWLPFFYLLCLIGLLPVLLSGTKGKD